MKYVLMALIRVYQWTISPILGPVCRFYPSCSRYAYEAIARHGAIYGTYLTVRRLLRCHPWNPGGVDLVPERGDRLPWSAWWSRHGGRHGRRASAHTCGQRVSRPSSRRGRQNTLHRRMIRSVIT